ncbi:MAG TPA: HYR domain-containing protein [Thermoanaerobaculia bacterium]|nr:HYR domain-containing protein [Thermoanaerobaculia bacterium]
MAAFADSIDRVSPSTIAFGNVEEFLTLYGSGLAGSESTLVLFDGTSAIEPNNVDSTSIVVWIPADILFVEGQHSVEVLATDIGGAVRRIGPAYFTISSDPNGGGGDDGPPSIQVPEFVIAEATGPNGALVTFEVVGTSRNGDDAPVVCSPASGSAFGFGVTLVSCTATDAFGSASASFVVFVTDTTPPSLTVPADIHSASAVVTFSASATDAIDGDVAVSCSPASGSTFRSGTTLVTCQAHDSRLNYAYGTFNVTVDDGAPTITVPDEVRVAATSAAGAVVTFNVTATGGATIACSPASGSTFPIGTTLVTCTATNAAGSDSGSFEVMVDDGPPELTVPANITAEATSAAGAVVTFEVTATDAVDGDLTPTCSHTSGSTFPLGTTTVTCTATDSLDATVEKSFDITVVDTTPPQIISLEASPSALWPPDHKMVDIALTAVVFDAVTTNPVTQIVSVSSDQPVNGTGDGDMAPDWAITGPLTLQLRSERSSGNDRTYTITVQSVDEAGNISQKTVQVKVTQSSRRRR